MEQIRHLQFALLFSATGVALCLYSILRLIHEAPKLSLSTAAMIVAVAVFDYAGWWHLKRAER